MGEEGVSERGRRRAIERRQRAQEQCFKTRLRRQQCRGGQSVFSLSFPEFCIAQRVLWYADGAEPRAEVGQ